MKLYRNQVLHLIYHGQIALVFGSHHHRAKDTGQGQDNGGCHIPGKEPGQRRYAAHHQGPHNGLKKLFFPKAGKQFGLWLHAQRDVEFQIFVHLHLLSGIVVQNQIFDLPDGFCDDVEDHRVAGALFILRRLFLGCGQAHQAVDETGYRTNAHKQDDGI